MGNAIYFLSWIKVKSQRVYLHHFKSIVVVHRAKIHKIVAWSKTYRPYCYRFRILTLHHGCVFIEEMCVVVCLFLQTSNRLNPTDQTDAWDY